MVLAVACLLVAVVLAVVTAVVLAVVSALLFLRMMLVTRASKPAGHETAPRLLSSKRSLKSSELRSDS